MLPPRDYPIQPETLSERILMHREGLVVVNKPWGVPTTGYNLDDPDCLQFWLMKHFRRKVWTPHQLDADTSGVVLFTLKKSLVPVLQQRMGYPRAQKTYLAWVHGTPTFERTRIDAPIGPWKRDKKVQGGGRRWGVCDSGKVARTRVEVLSRGGDYALVRCRLETGRTHQIRVHLEHIGHPLVGEEWYTNRPAEHTRQALHAWQLRFKDGERPDHFVAPVPDDLQELSTRLGLQVPELALPAWQQDWSWKP